MGRTSRTELLLSSLLIACGGGGHGIGDAPALGDGDRGGDASIPCGSDADCASKSCEGNACSSPAFIAYADSSGTGSVASGCVQADPCPTITDAIATGQPIIVATGSFDEQVVFADQAFERLKGNATLTASAGAPALRVSAHSVDVFDLTITGVAGDGACAVELPTSGDTLVMIGVTITGNSTCAVHSLGDLTIDRSTITANTGGGIAALADQFGSLEVTNSFIARNGSPTTSLPGLEYAEMGTPESESLVAFNTIVDNQTDGTDNAAGVSCGVGLAWPNNIVAGNVMAVGSGGQITGECSMPTSIIQVDHAGLAFVNDASDYHLTAGSIAIDAATTAPIFPVDDDFDGDPRPIGSASDIGADEFEP